MQDASKKHKHRDKEDAEAPPVQQEGAVPMEVAAAAEEATPSAEQQPPAAEPVPAKVHHFTRLCGVPSRARHIGARMGPAQPTKLGSIPVSTALLMHSLSSTRARIVTLILTMFPQPRAAYAGCNLV